jgi:hypothetical protein
VNSVFVRALDLGSVDPGDAGIHYEWSLAEHPGEGIHVAEEALVFALHRSSNMPG